MKTRCIALTGVAQLVGSCPTKRKVTNLVPSQGTLPGLQVLSLVGDVQEATGLCFPPTSMFLSLSLSFPSPLSKINK